MSDESDFKPDITDATLLEVHVLRSDQGDSLKSLFNLKVTPLLTNSLNLTRLENELYLAEGNLEHLSTRFPRTNLLEFLKIDCLEIDRQLQPITYSLLKNEFFEYSRSKKHSQLHELTYSIDDDLNTLFTLNPRSATASTFNLNNMNTHTLLSRIKNRSKFLVSLVTVRMVASSGQQSANLTLIFIFYEKLITNDDRIKLNDLKYYLIEKLLPKLNAASGNSSAYFINNYYKRIGLVNAINDTNESSKLGGNNYFRTFRNMLSAKNKQLPIIVICSGLLFFLLFIVLILFSVLKLIKSKHYDSVPSLNTSSKLDSAHVNLLIKTTGLTDSKRDSSLETHSNVSSNSTNTTNDHNQPPSQPPPQHQNKVNKMAQFLCSQPKSSDELFNQQYCSPDNEHMESIAIGSRRGEKFFAGGEMRSIESNAAANKQSDYLIDSPILGRKVFENVNHSNSEMNTKTYLQCNYSTRKQNPEYLFGNNNNNNAISNRMSNCSPHTSSNLVMPASAMHQNGCGSMANNKPKKKIKFNFNNNESQHESSINIEDDDFILPVKVTPKSGQNYQQHPNYHHIHNHHQHQPTSHNTGTLPTATTFRYNNEKYRQIQHEDNNISHSNYQSNTLNTTNGKNSNFSYKKCSMQPEDNIWVEKYTEPSIHQHQPHQFHNNNQNYHHHHHHHSFVNEDQNTSRSAIMFGPNDREIIL